MPKRKKVGDGPSCPQTPPPKPLRPNISVTLRHAVSGRETIIKCSHIYQTSIHWLHQEIASMGLAHQATISLVNVETNQPQCEPLSRDCTLLLCKKLLVMNNESLREAMSMYKHIRSVFMKRYGCLSYMDVSEVTDMAELFKDLRHETLQISGWITSKVTNMDWLFLGSVQIKADLSLWDTSNVTSMRGTFGATNWSPNISQWVTSKVTDMDLMFLDARRFNDDISAWDTSNVTSMTCMFSGARGFNADISAWDVSNVTNMQEMFCEAFVFNADISQWRPTSCTRFDLMFAGANAFNMAHITDWFP